MHITVIGYPGAIGGACSETWHTIKLWRLHGVDVTLIPTWKADPEWRTRCDAIGCKTDAQSPRQLNIPEGETVVSFCNHPFLHAAGKLRHCKTIWVPCMDYLPDAELTHYRKHGLFDRYVFQSEYQRDTLLPKLQAHGVVPDQCHLIRGAFDVDEFPFLPRPHRNGDPFVVGRLSRADPRKFSEHTWEIYGHVPNVRARVMGWSETIEQKLGAPPIWARTMPKGTEPTMTFLRSLHAIGHSNGGAVENWPRFALEAMAAGVPVITDNAGGLREMIVHGRTGYLCDSPRGMGQSARFLATREDVRQEMASRARCAVEGLADPLTIWGGWEKLFAAIGAS